MIKIDKWINLPIFINMPFNHIQYHIIIISLQLYYYKEQFNIFVLGTTYLSLPLVWRIQGHAENKHGNQLIHLVTIPGENDLFFHLSKRPVNVRQNVWYDTFCKRTDTWYRRKECWQVCQMPYLLYLSKDTTRHSLLLWTLLNGFQSIIL